MDGYCTYTFKHSLIFKFIFVGIYVSLCRIYYDKPHPITPPTLGLPWNQNLSKCHPTLQQQLQTVFREPWLHHSMEQKTRAKGKQALTRIKFMAMFSSKAILIVLLIPAAFLLLDFGFHFLSW